MNRNRTAADIEQLHCVISTGIVDSNGTWPTLKNQILELKWN
jgi:hypothetical protein